jgi:hypothetical protein
MKQALWGSGLVVSLSLTVLMSVLVVFAPRASQSQITNTSVCGPITADTAWTVISSPYVVCSGSAVSVAPGVTLTVQPGVTVQFQSNSKLTVNGTLLALGTSNAPITFTGASATPGSWQGIEIAGSITQTNRSMLSYVTVEYGGLGTSTGAQLYLSQADISITHALIRNGGGHGIYGATNGSANIADTTFVNNGAYAVLFGDGRVNPVLARLTATGNGTNGVGLGGGFSPLSGAHIWEYTGIPYVLVTGIQVTSDASLTVEPGTVVQGGSNQRLEIIGQLNAIGSITQPITFTSVTPSPGSWVGIVGAGTGLTPAQVTLDHVVVDYAGGGINGEAVEADRTVLTLTNSLIRNSAGDGVQTHQLVTTTIQNVQFVNNANNAVQLIIPTPALQLSNLSATGNGFDGITIASTTYWSGQRHLPFAGLPYKIDGLLGNFSGDSLTIDPGNELIFTSVGWLNIGGQIKAIGLPTKPITFTSVTKQPGDWIGLVVYGGSRPASAQLDYVTVEYGGSGSASNGANIDVSFGTLIARHSIIRYSAKAGVRFNSHASGSILNSQIVSNSQVVTTTYGLFNLDPAHSILATNNWWGDPNGPTPDLAACGSGHGDRVSTGVLYRPVLTTTNLNAEFPLSAAAMLTLTPRRWFAPAGGIIRVYFDITLRDGNGLPLAGRQTRLHTTLGTVVDGGVTDVTGHALAYLTSQTPGDADVYVTLDALAACEGATTPSAKITFTPPFTGTNLFPDGPAPYLSSALNIAPTPVTRGVTTTITAKFTNPLTAPITIDVDLEYAQSSIGLVFGPLATLTDVVIPASGAITLTQPWIPPISGHYCFQIRYAITAIGAHRINRPALNNFDGTQQKNTDSLFSGLKSADQRDILQKTTDALNLTGQFIDNAYDTDPFAIPLFLANQLTSWQLSMAQSMGNALAGDPPVLDYQQIALPQKLSVPLVQPNAAEHISQARADAMNAFADALASMNAYGQAAAIANDRNAGAAEAKDLQWQSLQTSALLDYRTQYAGWAITTSQKLNTLITQAAGEGDTSYIITPDQVRAFQQQLATTGFTAQQIADAHSVGMTDDYLSYTLHSLIAADPNVVAGDYIVDMQAVANNFEQLGNSFLHPVVFVPPMVVGGGAGLRATQAITSGNVMAQIYENSTTMLLSNPLTQTAVIDVLARRIDLPADWMVDVSPPQATLAPGDVTTVTVTMIPGSPAPQGSVPRVAVEGYAGSQLLGGVAVDVIVPNYVPGFLRVFVPLIRR